MERKRFLLFVALFALFIVMGLISHRSTSMYRENINAAARGQEFRTALREILSSLMENEASLRGFMLTGDERFLVSCSAAVDRVRQRLRLIADQAPEDSSRKQRLQSLRLVVDRKLDSTKAILNSWRAQLPLRSTFAQYVKRGEEEVEEVRERIISLDSEEEGLQRSWSAESSQMARWSTVLIVLGMLSAFVLVALANLIMYQEVQRRRRAEAEKDRAIAQLQEALDKVKLLSGLLPICAGCKKIRDDKGYWNQIEVYIRDHSEAEFSHGMCPECSRNGIQSCR